MPYNIYIAADWESDKDVVDLLRHWNLSPFSPISFGDVHEIKQARDTSLNCSIKESLRQRLLKANKFVLIVGENTESRAAGSCSYCKSYNSYSQRCVRGYSANFNSFIEFECNKAVENEMNIVVIHKFERIRMDLCPSSIARCERAVHLPLYYAMKDIYGRWQRYYNAHKIAEALRPSY